MKIFLFFGFSIILFTDIGLLSVSGDIVKFNVQKDNVTCIMTSFSGQIIDSSVSNKTYDIAGTLNKNESSCDENNQVLSINGTDYKLDFKFTKVNSSVMLSSVVFSLDDVNYSIDNNLYTVPEGKSFKCDSGITADLKHNQTTLKLELKSVRLNAYRKSDAGDDFESDSVCPGDGGSNKTVPMIIAFVLAGMVVIMLVGYIILRKREDKSTYQTV